MMTRPRFSMFVYVFTLLVLSLGRPVTAQPAKPAPVKDALGQTVTLPAAPSRIVSLAPSNTELLFALGLGSKIVGVTSYCDYPPEAKKKTVVGTYNNPSLEQIVALKPDLVLAAYGNPIEMVEQMRKMKIPVFSLNPKTLHDVLDDIRTVGTLTGRAAAASALVKTLNARIDAVAGKTRLLGEKDRPRVLFLGGWEPPFFVPGPGTFVNDLITIAGGRNFAADGQAGTWTQYSLETLVQKAPEIIVGTYNVGETAKIVNNKRLLMLKTKDGWRSMPAVQKGRIGAVYGDAAFRNSPRLVDALEEMARIIHPELFR